MTERSFDSNIVMDSLNGIEAARQEIANVTRSCISRLTWIEVMSKGDEVALGAFERFMTVFEIDEVDDRVCRRAAALRREQPRLKLPDTVILASAQIHGRTLVSRNTRDFPETTPGVRVPYSI